MYFRRITYVTNNLSIYNLLNNNNLFTVLTIINYVKSKLLLKLCNYLFILIKFN